MLKTYSRIALPVITTFSLSLSAYAGNIPEAYKFVSDDSLFTIDLNPSPAIWPVLTTNKTLKKIDLFKELSKDDSFMGALLDEKVRKNFGNNIIFSFSNFDFNAKDPDFGGVIVEELKDRSSISYIKDKLKKIYASKPEFKLANSRYKDAEIISYSSTKNDKAAKDKAAYFAFINNYVVVSNKMSSLQDSLKNFYGEKSNITTSSDFSRSFDKVGSDFQGQFYLNMKQLVNSLGKNKEFTKTMKTMNLESLMSMNSITFNFNLDPKGAELRSYSILDKNSKYGQMISDLKTSDFKKYINYVPKNTLFYFSSSDVKDNGKILKESLAQFSGKDMDLEKIIKDNTGISFLELVDNLKDEFGIAIFNVESSPLIPGFAIFSNPKDKEKMISQINAMKINLSDMDKGKRSQKKTDPTIMQFSSTKKYKDIDMSIANSVDDLGKVNIQPAYAFIGDNMVLASNEEILKSVIDRSKNNATDFTLEGNSSFARYRQMYGEQSNGIGFINLATIINMLNPLLSGDKSFKDMLDNLKKFDSIGVNTVIDKDGGSFSRINLLADIENIDFEKLVPPQVKEFADAQNKAKIASTKANMYTLQTMVETYGVDNTGNYSDNLLHLKTNARQKKYWKELKNPFTSTTGLGKKGVLMDFKDYKNFKGKKSDLKGITLYEPFKCSYDNTSKKNSCSSYKIYGLDEKGEYIKKDGKVVILTNL